MITPDVTVIIPAFNESEGIGKTLEDLVPVAKEHQWRITVVNDGSTDDTAVIVGRHDYVDLVSHPYNKGYGASLKTGILQSRTKYVAFYDADGQHNPNDLRNLVEKVENSDMIVGQRSKTSHQDWIRKPGKWILSKVANFLTGRKIPDLNSGLRVVRRNVIASMLHLFPSGFSFSTTSTIAFFNSGYSVSYFPIQTARRVGKSTVKQLKHGSSTLLLILRLVVLFNPLKVFIPTSLVFLLMGIVYEVIAGVIYQPVHPKLIPGAFFLMLTGVLIFFFGLVVDQISELRKQFNNNARD